MPLVLPPPCPTRGRGLPDARPHAPRMRRHTQLHVSFGGICVHLQSPLLRNFPPFGRSHAGLPLGKTLPPVPSGRRSRQALDTEIPRPCAWIGSSLLSLS